MKEGNTRPGQSQSMRASETIRVWKCFVLPGVEDTATRVTPVLSYDITSQVKQDYKLESQKNIEMEMLYMLDESKQES